MARNPHKISERQSKRERAQVGLGQIPFDLWVKTHGVNLSFLLLLAMENKLPAPIIRGPRMGISLGD